MHPETERVRVKRKTKRSKSVAEELFLENASAIRKVQMELNNRMKEREIRRAKRAKTDFGESYPLLYQQYRTEIEQKQLYSLPRFTDLSTTKEGIICYEEFEDKPTIVNYLQGRLKEKAAIRQREVAEQ